MVLVSLTLPPRYPPKGFFGSVEEDKGEHIAAKQEFNLVKDEFGRWVDPKKKARAAALRKQRGRHACFFLAGMIVSHLPQL